MSAESDPAGPDPGTPGRSPLDALITRIFYSGEAGQPGKQSDDRPGGARRPPPRVDLPRLLGDRAREVIGLVTGVGTPTLDRYARDLTAQAVAGQLDPVIGRAVQIEQTVEVLSRRTKNNPVLIGDPGVGKTAIVEGIAQRVVKGDVPATLAGRRVVTLDLAGMVAGTKYRGEFEARLKAVIDEIREHADSLVIFIDELHTVVGAGTAEGVPLDAGNMLKPALARGELHVIGATTIEEYRSHIERDAALERRFQPVLVPEPSVEDTVEILRGLRATYEAHHRIRYSDEALVAAAELSARYITDRFLPDKAVDLMDQVGARVRLRAKPPVPAGPDRDKGDKGLEKTPVRPGLQKAAANGDHKEAGPPEDEPAVLGDTRIGGIDPPEPPPSVTVTDVAAVVAAWTGIPISELTEEERSRLLRLEEHLHDRVVGQDEAVTAVAEAVRRARIGLGDPGRPIGSFLFLGPTGVGKTELARSLAAALFGDPTRMVRFDMSEFQESHTVSRLVGAPPGYVGHGEAGQLTGKVRRQPYSVLLFDEVEKAHPDVFNVLLQLLDDGRVTDAQGRTVDFKHTVVIMTSNFGADLILASRDRPFDALREMLLERLGRHFRPEFLNRIDEIIVFRALDRSQIHRITRLLLERTAGRLSGQGIALEVSDPAVDWIADRGYQPEFGARPLRRTVQREVENPLTRLVLEGAVPRGGRVRVDVLDGRLAFGVPAEGGVAAAPSLADGTEHC